MREYRLMTACASEYAACMQDNESGGCINCSQLLAGNAGSGINCDNTPTILMNLLTCGCTATTCD